MADRSAARAFGLVFQVLARTPTENAKRAARAIFAAAQHRRDGFDFSPNQMDCDRALARLGLARRGVHPDWPEDGKVWLYGPEKRNG